MDIDYNATITTLALIVALGVAIRDSCIRLADRRKRTNIYLSYYRRDAELLAQRLSSVKGAIEKHKSIRLGAQRPYEAFKFTALILKKCRTWSSEHQLSILENLSEKTSLQLSLLLGEIPSLISNFEALMVSNSSVTINEQDQDLIKFILEKIDAILEILKDLFKFNEEHIQKLTNQYYESLHDGN
ncbi:hypothetical protein [Stutzerimonas stutzeri]|uniref:hypothetical protein n=1 Tax=Stutzerimonas stutzeri TaxID=316 RepID=UPI0015E2F624|nr:hypothetical protein [Stutzerimonas stutzeri]MBA1278798.1 hypothetical protein [Stutzerimonas stutzeri]